VPIILMLQAGMFAVPYALWRVLSSRSGIDLATIVGAARSSQQLADAEQREKMRRLTVAHYSESVFRTCLPINTRITSYRCHAYRRVLS